MNHMNWMTLYRFSQKPSRDPLISFKVSFQNNTNTLIVSAVRQTVPAGKENVLEFFSYYQEDKIWMYELRDLLLKYCLWL